MTRTSEPDVGTRQRSRRLLFLALLAGAIVVVAFALPRLPQDPGYHAMADRRTIFGVPNALNVLSNLAFLAVGLTGVLSLTVGGLARRAFVSPWERRPYLVLFAGALLTAAGSAYYHLAPDDARLFWDRLPMTLGFMGLLTAVLAERVGTAFARAAFLPLVLGGAASVVSWRVTGDLRLYAAVQFGSLILVLAMLVLFRSRRPGDGLLWSAVFAYGAAKLVEAGDAPIFALGHVVSGHTVKHLLAALSVGFVWLALRSRSRGTGKF